MVSKAPCSGTWQTDRRSRPFPLHRCHAGIFQTAGFRPKRVTRNLPTLVGRNRDMILDELLQFCILLYSVRSMMHLLLCTAKMLRIENHVVSILIVISLDPRTGMLPVTCISIMTSRR